MQRLGREVIDFLKNQSFVVVSTIDNDGTPHNSCKGIVNIEPDGKVFLFDLYKSRTFCNLQQNPRLSITAVDEHSFSGYCLKGKAKIVERDKLEPRILSAWEDRIISRVTKRLIKNIKGEKGHNQHPEAVLPQPEYMIVMQIDKIVDLSPHLKGGLSRREGSGNYA